MAEHRWLADLAQLEDEQLNELRPLHWGQHMPLYEIVTIISAHHLYHAGELNQVLSIRRGEAWEETEEVEENNISTTGHRVKPPWLDNRDISMKRKVSGLAFLQIKLSPTSCPATVLIAKSIVGF